MRNDNKKKKLFIDKSSDWIVNFFIKYWLPSALVFIIGAIYLIGYLPQSQVHHNLLLQNKLRATYATIIGGIGAFIIIIVQIYKANLLKKQTEQKQEQNDEQRRSNIRSLTLDQYIRAVDQLKDKSMAVILGGIYSLEKIMNSPDKEVKDYHDTIIELLCAYVREKRPFDINKYNKDLEKYKSSKKENEDIFDKYRIKLRTDIQAILTVLGRRKNRDNEKVKIDLNHSNLYKYDLSGAHLEGAKLEGAHLEGAKLEGAHLEGAKLEGAHLEGAKLPEAHLEGADLFRTHLEGADLFRTHLEGADLSGAHLEGAKLEGAHLSGAHLEGAHLEGAELPEAHLERAYLRGVHLEKAILIEAHLEESNLWGAHLEGADLSGAHLEKAKLPEAHLEGAYFYETYLENAYLGYSNFINIKIIPLYEKREEIYEDIITFIIELEKAKDVEGIKLNDRIMKIIEEEYPNLLKRINCEKY